MECSLQSRTGRGIVAFALSGLLACGVLVPVDSALAVTAAEKEAEAQSALTQLSAMQETLDQASAQYYAALSEYQQAVEQRDATAERIDALNDEISDVQGRLGVRAREMYRNGATSFLDLLLGAASFDEFTQNWDLLNRVNETDADLSSKARVLRAEAQEQEAAYAAQAKVAEQKSEEAATAYQEARILVEQMQATYDSLSAEALMLYEQEQAAVYAATEGGIQNDDGTVTDIATGQVYSSAAAYSAATGNAIVDRAMAMLGRGYSYGSTGADGMFDCSGLVGYAITGTFDRIGNTYTFLGYNQVSDPQPGDICVNAGHTGIYIGDGQMVHAGDESTGVIVGPVQSGMIYVRP